MADYVEPKDVKSPRDWWTLIDVLVTGGSEEHAVAIGEWDGERRLAMRWNGTKEKPSGHPQSRGNAMWFMMPTEYNAVLVETLPDNKKIIAKALLGI